MGQGSRDEDEMKVRGNFLVSVRLRFLKFCTWYLTGEYRGFIHVFQCNTTEKPEIQ